MESRAFVYTRKKKGERGRGVERGELTRKPEAVWMVAEAIAYPRPRLSWQRQHAGGAGRSDVLVAANKEGTERNGH